jgi:Cu/Ag efflux pump CusA
MAINKVVTLAINKMVALAINKVVMMLVVPAMMAKHVRGMQMTVTTWMKCLRPLDQKY